MLDTGTADVALFFHLLGAFLHRLALALDYGSLVLAVAIVALMVFKP